MAVSVSGGPTFALLHGGGQGSWVWHALRDRLEALGARVVLLDVPGCGTKRERGTAAIDATMVAHELVEDCRAAGSGPIVLVGHSLAGAILPRMAELTPDLFGRLIYLSCSAPNAGVSFANQIGKGVHGDDPETVGWPVDPATHSTDERYRAMFCNEMSDAEGDAFLSQLGHDHWPMDVLTRTDHRYDHLSRIASTYIVCERDRALPAGWQRRFAERLRCDRIVSLDACHQAMNTRPGPLADLLLAEAGLPFERPA